MQAVGTKKTRQASGLLLALVASTLMLGGCGDSVFFANEGATTTAAATDTGSTGSAPTPTPTPGTTSAAATTNGTTPAANGATPTPTPTPSGGSTPVPAPTPNPTGGTTPTPTPTPNPTPSPTPPPPAPTPTPSAGSIGKTLWANNCQACHGGSTSKGSNSSNTLAAIRGNTGGMGFLSGSIGATEASQIATYAANPGAY